MTFSPKTRANIASLLVIVPLFVVRLRYDHALSQRSWIYIWLACGLISAILYQWVYHRHSEAPTARALPPAELSLTHERVPGLVWTALVPPVILMILLWWVTFYGSGLPWRDGWLGPPRPAASHRLFLPVMIMVIIWTSIGSWKVLYSLARWHGMPRTYPHRRERLLNAVRLQWISLVAVLAWASGNIFYLPAPLATTCAIAFGVGLFPIIASGTQEYRWRTTDPHTGTWCYFDLQDPAFLGPRGLNLANRWALALIAAGLAPVVLAEWLYHHAQG